MRFDWDPEKAASNLMKHGVSFEEAASVFADPLALYGEDPDHPGRTRVIGASARRRLLFCVFVERDEHAFRIISARRVTAHERRRYEEGTEA
ncbi:MAG: BrnT family toxin [Anaeromyxobacter sp.]